MILIVYLFQNFLCFSDRIRFSEVAKLFVAQVPRHISDIIMKTNEDILATRTIEIKKLQLTNLKLTNVKLRLTHNTRYNPGDQIHIWPCCKFINVFENPFKLEFDKDLNRLVAFVKIRKKEKFKNVHFYLENNFRFGKIWLHQNT